MYNRKAKFILPFIFCAVTLITGVLTPSTVFAKSDFGKCMSKAQRKWAAAETRCSKKTSAKATGLCRKASFQAYKKDVAKCRKNR